MTITRNHDKSLARLDHFYESVNCNSLSARPRRSYWGSGSWSYEKVAGRTSGWLLPADRSIAWSEFTFFNYSISMHA